MLEMVIDVDNIILPQKIYITYMLACSPKIPDTNRERENLLYYFFSYQFKYQKQQLRDPVESEFFMNHHILSVVSYF